jgi:transposase
MCPAAGDGRGSGRPGGSSRRSCTWTAPGAPGGICPPDFPPWQTVYTYFAAWRDDGTLARLHAQLRTQVRAAAGRKPQPTAAVIDSQSVRAADTVPKASRGWDAAKKASGRKRHIAVDTMGLVLDVVITAASVQDRQGARPLLWNTRRACPRIRLIWADAGCTSTAGKLASWAGTLKMTLCIVARRDRHTFEVLPHRWVVERTFAWISKHRRTVRDYEHLPASHEAMILWAMTALMTRRLTQPAELSDAHSDRRRPGLFPLSCPGLLHALTWTYAASEPSGGQMIRAAAATGAFVMVGAVTGLAYAAQNPPAPVSQAVVLVVPPPNAATQAVMATSNPVLEGALQRLDSAASIASLAQRVQVRNVTNLVIVIRAQGPTADSADATANAVADSFVTYEGQQHRGMHVIDNAVVIPGPALSHRALIPGIVGALIGLLAGIADVITGRRRYRAA